MGSVLGAVAAPVTSIVGGILGKNGAFGSQNTYSAQSAPLTTQDNLTGNTNLAFGRTGNVYDQQQALAQALLAQSQGQGPSLAQMQLQDATNRNIKQNAGLISSQKGVNPALAARLIANQSAQAGQSLAGQSAQARLMEQMQAQQQLGGLYGNLAQQQLQQQQILQNAISAQNNAALGNASQMNQVNAGVANQNAAFGQKLLGGIAEGSGAGLAQILGGSGSQTPAQISSNIWAGGSPSASRLYGAEGGIVPGKAETKGDSPKNDKVPAMLSPGEIVIPRSAAKSADTAKAFIDALKESNGDSEEPSYAKVLDAHRKLEKKVKDLEKKLKGA